MKDVCWLLIHVLNSTKLNRHRSTCGNQARDRVNWIMEIEHHATFSLNAEYHLSYRRNFEAFYKGTRWRWLGIGSIVRRISVTQLVAQIPDSSPAEDEADSPDSPALRPITPVSPAYNFAAPRASAQPHVETDAEKRERLLKRLESGQPTDIPEVIKLIPANSSDHAIEIMADVRAYWQGTFLCVLFAICTCSPFSRRQWRSNVASTIFL